MFVCKVVFLGSVLNFFLENIWWERKKYLPLQPQTRNKRPRNEVSGLLVSE